MINKKKYKSKTYKSKKSKNVTLNRRQKSKKYLDDIIEKRYLALILIIIVLFCIIGVRLFRVSILENNSYNVKLAKKTEKIIIGTSTPRGRIYDRNGNIVVDNEAIKTIYYKKEKGISIDDEIALAYRLSDMIDVSIDKLSDKELKRFWVLNNEDSANDKITDDEWKKYTERKLTLDEIFSLKLERVTEEEINEYTERDKEASYIYYLMNKGYSYDEKIIKNVDVLEEEYAIISENTSSLKGVNTKLDWDRIYLYGDTFKTILGKVSSDHQGIPAELKDYYLKHGYALNDRVGISYLEYQYEEYLKGEKATYRLLQDNSYELIDEGRRGNDIVLTIDIKLQQELERIVSEEVLAAKKEPNTEYYNRSFVVISDPNTGEILAMSGKQVLQNDKGEYYVVDYTPGIVTLPVTPGSIVKGASIAVGYKYKAIDIGTTQVDECIKIKDTPIKCSWRTMGLINDITALQLSSNVYQFKIAINVGGGVYRYNEALPLDKKAFSKYRLMYNSFGLGLKTNIDLPVESLGYKGTSTLPGHLLDFSIGQYDTYTPIQLSQYINTIANGGSKIEPYLVKEIYAPSNNQEEQWGDIIYKKEKTVNGVVDLEQKYMDRIREGFRAVMLGSLGWGYMGNVTTASGKTGTSQSFIDTNDDGVVDTETITHTFGGYAPYDNPKMSIVTISPDISHENNGSLYTSGVNRRITSRITNKFFEMYQ